ncbi:manganese-dependent ADP-ribose/CDP-alcohol diphosphatase [Crotalus adamanteus]|uniref:Manganese-dependent ADP-ribose/CDP-alcohol diphosphatase n=1 Tax=Crotalus adamanteus TaxID=8729 RepID=A0AAW1BYA8_CROAD
MFILGKFFSKTFWAIWMQQPQEQRLKRSSPLESFILLDAYDLSILGRETSTKKYKESLQLLQDKNHNENLNSPLGLAECNFVQFNGGFSQDQLDWVDKVLTYADENQERVVIAGHIPINPYSYYMEYDMVMD